MDYQQIAANGNDIVLTGIRHFIPSQTLDCGQCFRWSEVNAVTYTGLRPGEKLYEELLTDAEATEATLDRKIRIVKARALDTASIARDIKALVAAAHRGDTFRSVRIMKRLLPEFKSNNSRFESIDHEPTPAEPHIIMEEVAYVS